MLHLGGIITERYNASSIFTESFRDQRWPGWEIWNSFRHRYSALGDRAEIDYVRSHPLIMWCFQQLFNFYSPPPPLGDMWWGLKSLIFFCVVFVCLLVVFFFLVYKSQDLGKINIRDISIEALVIFRTPPPPPSKLTLLMDDLLLPFNKHGSI